MNGNAAVLKLAGLSLFVLTGISFAAAQQESAEPPAEQHSGEPVAGQEGGGEPATEQPRAMQLPGGATALSETHGNWVVNCRIANNARVCTYSFQQFDRASNQRAFAIELAPRQAIAGGTLALPFGLDLAKGVTLAIDNRALAGPLPFSTCLIVGCLVPVSFDAAAQLQLRAAASLKVTGTIHESGEPVDFSIPLNGFTSASARTAQLLGN
jgi:invasion protein IalB